MKDRNRRYDKGKMKDGSRGVNGEAEKGRILGQ